MHAIRVSHNRAVTGCIGVGLKHPDALRYDAVSVGRGCVVLDLGSRAVAQDPLMNEREMTDVKEVLDNARPARPDAVRPRNQHPIRRILEQLELWDPASAAAETDPYDVIRRRRVKGGDLRLCRRDLLRVGRHEHTPPVRSIRPTVVRALEPHAVDDPTKGEPGASMHAQVTPREELFAGTPHHEVLAEHPGGNRSTVCQLRDKRYGVPIVYEDRVIDHRDSSSERPRRDDATPP